MKEDNNFCTIYLIRYGEAEGNVKEIMMGHLDLPLTEKGKIQVRDVSQRLKHVHFDFVYSSDLVRAKQTAELIAQERNLAVQTSKLLRERSYGIHEGKSRAEYTAKARAFWEELNKLSEEARKNAQYPDGIESDASLASRMITFLREIAVANPGKTVLVVAHGAIIRNFLIHVGFAKREELPMFRSLENGAFIKLMSDGIDFIVKETAGGNKETKNTEKSGE